MTNGLEATLDAATRLKRLKMRAWRRGTREMDLLLGGYVDHLAETGSADLATLDALDALLIVEDPTLYAWLSEASEPASEHAPLVARIRAHHGG